VEVLAELASRVTDAVMEDAGDWRSRPLGKCYAVVCLDALRVSSRQDGKSCQKSVYAALGGNFEGKKEAGETPFRTGGGQRKTGRGAKFRAPVPGGICNRGTEDILIARMDGLSGFPDAVRAVFPRMRVQRRIVHMVRNSARFVSYKDLKEVCAGLKAGYRAPSEEAGRAALGQR
jgi:transposase-like protein